MSEIQFEPFGEQVEKYTSASGQSPLQRAVSRAGIGIFWTLVAGIVIARAIFFDPDFSQGFVAYVSNGMHTILGG